jgi:hypothetical protein
VLTIVFAIKARANSFDSCGVILDLGKNAYHYQRQLHIVLKVVSSVVKVILNC